AKLQAVVGRAGAGGAAVLAGLGVALRLVADRPACALQEEVGRFTTGKLGLGAEVTCHVKFLGLASDASLFRPARVWRVLLLGAQTVVLTPSPACGRGLG